MSRTPVTYADIAAARGIIAGRLLLTPTLPAPRLSALTGAEVYVKYENLQVTNSFKERGAIVKLEGLDEAARTKGVIAMSAGNHAQAVAYHATRLGIPSTIVMPETTPHVKVAATRNFGARVILDGETLAESRKRCEQVAAAEGLTLVHPYDDPAIIAGQGTIGIEMLEAVPELDTLLVPIGGGGLIGGIALAAKTIKPSIRMIGIEAALYPSMWNVVHGEKRPCGGITLAEGIAVKDAGMMTRELVRDLVDDIVLASETDLERAVNAFVTVQKTMAEGAGAAGLAALLADPERFKGSKVGLVLCGGNIDPRILASIMVRELEREGKICAVRLTIQDRPGVLGDIAATLGRLGANILEVEHRRLFLDVPAKGTKLDITFEARDVAHADAIMERLAEDGFAPMRIDPGASDVI